MNQQFPSVYNTPSLEAQEDIQRSFIMRVYAWMAFGLFVTAGAALATVSYPPLLALITTNRMVFFGLIIAELALVVAMTAAVNRISPAVASILFITYAAINGVTLSIIMLVYTASSIALTFGIAACTFGIMTLWGYTTHRDLTKLGSLLFMGLVGILLASIVNIFLRSSGIYWITSYLGVLIFIGLVAYDTQKLKRMSLMVGQEGDTYQKASINGALALYLDFINLFLFLLRILGRRK